MNAIKEARHDAREYARARMFYGEGAGIRRKLIQATVDGKAHKDPNYARAFHVALAEQDMAEHAEKARSERKRIDRTSALSRNTKAILTGNSKSMNTGVIIVAGLAYVAHQTGYDKAIYNKVKTKVRSARNRYYAKGEVKRWLKPVPD